MNESLKLLTEEELEHIVNIWRPPALCQMCRDILAKLDRPEQAPSRVTPTLIADLEGKDET